MTGREQLNRRKRWLGAAVLAAVVLLLLGMGFSPVLGGAATLAVTLSGFVALAAAVLLGQFFALRCPWCRTKVGTVLMHTGFLRIDPRVRYCPYCGADFDDDPEAGRWDDPVE